MSDSLFVKNYVDKQFESQSNIDSASASQGLLESLKKDFDDDRFEKLLIVTGWIPDLYANESSEETLYSKMIEVLVAEWGRRIGGTGECISVKADHEDVKISIADSAIICDAKSFRLSRSQKAPNPKDMVKPDAFKAWCDRYNNSIGGLVTFPSTHDWKRSSVVYRDFSSKENPIVFLSYRHLALLLHYKNRYQVQDILKLWDYENIFPEILSNNANKKLYWEEINNTICGILSISMQELQSYMDSCDKEIKTAINDYLSIIETSKNTKIKEITNEVESEDLETLRRTVIAWRTKNEASDYDKFIERINKFRL